MRNTSILREKRESVYALHLLGNPEAIKAKIFIFHQLKHCKFYDKKYYWKVRGQRIEQEKTNMYNKG